MENVKTASGSQLSNDLINQVLADSDNKKEYEAEITAPSDTTVNLPAGLITPSGEVLRTAEVRELTGRDEEYIAKAGGIGKAFSTILSRGVVKIGDTTADEKMLDAMLSGDRDALMLGVFKATFGSELEIPAPCNGCGEMKLVAVDIDRDVPVKVLIDPIEDRTFTVQGKKNEYLVTLPTGVVQKEITENAEKGEAELTTSLLEHTILEINGSPVVTKAQVLNMGIVDRRKISTEISKRIPGPQFDGVTITCPDCEGEVVVPFNLGAFFRY
jgi:hypothetical protein